MKRNTIFDGDVTVPINRSAVKELSSGQPETLSAQKKALDSLWGPNCPELGHVGLLPKKQHRYINYIDKTYGSLRVLGFTTTPSKNGRAFVVKCSCGRYGSVSRATLRKDFPQCPVCLGPQLLDPYLVWTKDPVPVKTDRGLTDYIGKQYRFFTVLGRTTPPNRTKWSVALRCKCGTYGSVAKLDRILSGRISMCSWCTTYTKQKLQIPTKHKIPDWWPVNESVLSELDTMVDIMEQSRSRFVCSEL